MIYLSALTVPHAAKRRTVGCLVNNELEKIWKETVAA
jgi:hypothetical protein